MNHTQLLNHLISKHNLKSYLEIGVRTTEQNFDKIRCEGKIGVDPAYTGTDARIWKYTSDEFFEKVQPKYFPKIDLIFIDGLHHSDQVQRDFSNSLRCLTDDGFIVIHDCLPEERITTCVPRGSQKIWHGDVYKFTMNLQSYDGIDFLTYDFDCGCCVVWKDSSKKGTETVDTSWENYKLNGRKLMRVTNELP